MKSLLRTHLIIAIVSFIILSVSLGVVLRFASSMKVREERVIEARDRLASFEQNKRTFSEEAKDLEGIRSRTEKLEASIVTEASVPELLSSLEATAAARGIDFTITAVESGTSGTESAGTLHIDFSASGALADLEAFSQDVLSSEYEAQFKSFSLYRQGESGGKEKAAPGSWQLLAGMDIISY